MQIIATIILERFKTPIRLFRPISKLLKHEP
jgi:hypothetical protein